MKMNSLFSDTSHGLRRWAWASGGAVLIAATAWAADADGDGLDDAFEAELMNRFAPIVRLHPDDAYRPAWVPWYLARVQLYFDQFGSDHEVLNRITSVSSLISQVWEGQYSGNTTPEPSDQTDFYLKIPDDGNSETTRGGDLSAALCYAHVRRAPSHHPMMYDLQYWFFYAFNGQINTGPDITSHEGDWEHITVRVEADGRTIHRIFFAAHGDSESHWYDVGGPGSGYTLIAGRPVIYSAWHSHASYPWAGTWDRPDNPVDDYAANGGPTWDCLGRTLNIGEGNWPAADMEWIQFTGHWGRMGPPGIWRTGPYGPAFQEPWNADVVGEDTPGAHGWVFVCPSCLWPPYYTTIASAVNAVPNGGTIWIWPGTYSGAGTYSKPMTWRAWAPGSVAVGN